MHIFMWHKTQTQPHIPFCNKWKQSNTTWLTLQRYSYYGIWKIKYSQAILLLHTFGSISCVTLNCQVFSSSHIIIELKVMLMLEIEVNMSTLSLNCCFDCNFRRRKSSCGLWLKNAIIWTTDYLIIHLLCKK